jgi:hypothetical protein
MHKPITEDQARRQAGVICLISHQRARNPRVNITEPCVKRAVHEFVFVSDAPLRSLDSSLLSIISLLPVILFACKHIEPDVQSDGKRRDAQ